LSLVTLSRDHDYKYSLIIGASSLFLGIALVTMLSGPILTPSSGGLSMDEISACRQKIISSEQMGYYSSPEQFRLAESYCYVK
jgi:hypothetical protein